MNKSLNIKLAQPIPVTPNNASIIDALCIINKGKRKRRYLTFSDIYKSTILAEKLMNNVGIYDIWDLGHGSRYNSSVTNLPKSYKYQAYQSRFSLINKNCEWCLDSIWTETIEHKPEIMGEILLTDFQQYYIRDQASTNKIEFTTVDFDHAELTQLTQDLMTLIVRSKINCALLMCA